jgi:FKBP-type peptidyl-prolyl cis-trans isomerase FklB
MMKRLMIVALVLVAGASLCHIDAKGRKRTVKATQQERVVPRVRLATSSDSVSYAGGMVMTNGLVAFLTQQQGVDTAYMADFVKGFEEVVKAGSDPKAKARVAGMEIAGQLRDRMLPGMTKEFTDSPDSIVASLFYRGFTDALMKDTSLLTLQAAEAYFREKQVADKAAKEEKLYGPNRDAGRRFLEENAKKDGVVVLPSGLQYKVLVKGEGEIPQKDQKVMVNYEGRLIDGTVFDASKRHGDKPSEFRPTQVIKGWTEALTMMPVGSKWQLYIPYELAYGDREAGEIKPYSTLIFDLELVGIDKPKPVEPESAGQKSQKRKK